MSYFVLKHDPHDIIGLYLVDYDKEGFIKVAGADKAELLKGNCHAILTEKDPLTKTLYGIKNNKVFNVELPLCSKVEILDKTCVYQRGKIWHTIEDANGQWSDRKLGIKHSRFMSCSEILKYGIAEWIFFLNDLNGKVTFSQFVKNKLVDLGTYHTVKISNSKIIVSDDGKYFDVFRPSSDEKVNGKELKTIRACEGVLVWINNKNKWVFHADCELFGNNGIYKVTKDEQGKKKIALYRIDAENLALVAEGMKFRFRYNHSTSYLWIDGIGYFIDNKTGLVDFDHPKQSLKNRLKKLFKKAAD